MHAAIHQSSPSLLRKEGRIGEVSKPWMRGYMRCRSCIIAYRDDTNLNLLEDAREGCLVDARRIV